MPEPKKVKLDPNESYVKKVGTKTVHRWKAGMTREKGYEKISVEDAERLIFEKQEDDIERSRKIRSGEISMADVKKKRNRVVEPSTKEEEGNRLSSLLEMEREELEVMAEKYNIATRKTWKNETVVKKIAEAMEEAGDGLGADN